MNRLIDFEHLQLVIAKICQVAKYCLRNVVKEIRIQNLLQKGLSFLTTKFNLILLPEVCPNEEQRTILDNRDIGQINIDITGLLSDKIRKIRRLYKMWGIRFFFFEVIDNKSDSFVFTNAINQIFCYKYICNIINIFILFVSLELIG